MAGTARQVHLGRQLRELRKAAGLSLKDAAARLGKSRASVGHWETGYYRPGQADLEALLELYGAVDEVAGHLLQLRKEAAHRGWWEGYKLPSYMSPFLGFEAEAAEKFHFELGVIPGLLQTADYAGAVSRVGRFRLPEEEHRSWVEARLRRQERLKPGGGLLLHTVVAEEALHRVVGSRAIMARQMEHLEKAATLSSVSFRVVPYEAGAHVAMVGPIIVLRFADGSADDVALAETPLGGHILDDVRDVAELTRLFAALQAQALPEEESLEVVRSIRDEHAAR